VTLKVQRPKMSSPARRSHSTTPNRPLSNAQAQNLKCIIYLFNKISFSFSSGISYNQASAVRNSAVEEVYLSIVNFTRTSVEPQRSCRCRNSSSSSRRRRRRRRRSRYSVEGVKDLPQLIYPLVGNVDLAGDLQRALRWRSRSCCAPSRYI
jgi:hypothetical protein